MMTVKQALSLKEYNTNRSPMQRFEDSIDNTISANISSLLQGKKIPVGYLVSQPNKADALRLVTRYNGFEFECKPLSMDPGLFKFIITIENKTQEEEQPHQGVQQYV